MNYLYLLFMPAVACGSCNKNCIYYLGTKYYNEHPVHLTLTDQQKTLSDIVSLVEGLVDRYMHFNETDSSVQEHLSFNLLPLTEYKPKKIYHTEGGYVSNDIIYKTTYYISHFNKLETRLVWTDNHYNFVRFTCYITTPRTLSCTAAYNEPMSPIFRTIMDVLFIFFLIFVCCMICIGIERLKQLQLQVEARSNNSKNRLTERSKLEDIDTDSTNRLTERSKLEDIDTDSTNRLTERPKLEDVD